MPSWLLKAAMQGVMSALPASDRLNYLLQRHVTGSVVLSDEVFERKVAQCSRHIRSYQTARDGAGLPSLALELGTGWYPVVPVGLALAGVARVVTVDVSSLLSPERTRQVLAAYAPLLRSGQAEQLLPQIAAERADAVMAAAGDRASKSAAELLEPLGIEVRIGDARASGLPAGSVDLFVSNNTFEHIAPQVLREIVAEFKRLAAAGAVMDHFVDMSDHYAHFDGSITEFNYLRYSDRAWRLFNNRLQYQSRLRIPDYRRILEEGGFSIVAEDDEQGPADDLARVELAPRFRHYAVEDLLTLRVWLTAVSLRAADARTRPA
jgi:hypothetical protein